MTISSFTPTVKADMEICFLNLDVPIWVVQAFPGGRDRRARYPGVACQHPERQRGTSGWGNKWVKYAQRYLAHWEKTRLLLLAFLTTHPIEQGFSQVLHKQSKYCNRLDLTASGALWMKLTSLQAAVKKLAENHQATRIKKQFMLFPLKVKINRPIIQDCLLLFSQSDFFLRRLLLFPLEQFIRMLLVWHRCQITAF